MTFDDKAPTNSPELLIELLGVVPRLVERTRSQAEFARSLASMLPCVGALMPARPTADDPAGAPEHENVDVLSVLAEDSPPDPAVMEHTAGVEVIGASPRPVTVGPEADPVRTKAITTDTTPPPDEADLPIQDYDSLGRVPGRTPSVHPRPRRAARGPGLRICTQAPPDDPQSR